MREVRINKVLNGYVVGVGCQTLVFTDATVMIAETMRYFANPAEVEKEYLAKYTPDMIGPPTPAAYTETAYDPATNQVPMAGRVYGGTSRG